MFLVILLFLDKMGDVNMLQSWVDKHIHVSTTHRCNISASAIKKTYIGPTLVL